MMRSVIQDANYGTYPGSHKPHPDEIPSPQEVAFKTTFADWIMALRTGPEEDWETSFGDPIQVKTYLFSDVNGSRLYAYCVAKQNKHPFKGEQGRLFAQAMLAGLCEEEIIGALLENRSDIKRRGVDFKHVYAAAVVYRGVGADVDTRGCKRPGYLF